MTPPRSNRRTTDRILLLLGLPKIRRHCPRQSGRYVMLEPLIVQRDPPLSQQAIIYTV